MVKVLTRSLIQIFFYILPFCLYSSAAIDLETFAQDFIIETKKIEIPGYPDAFNPSIIRWKGALLLCFRIIPDPRFTYTTRPGLVWLDEEFNPISQPQILETNEADSPIPPRAEDARLVQVGEKLLLVYSDNRDKTLVKKGFRVHFAEVIYDGNTFSLKNIERINEYEGESEELREKNWTPFDYNGQLHLAYSIVPHLILRPIIGTGSCETAASTQGEIYWDWGILRGGTPAISVGDEYLTFFHSMMPMETIHSEGRMMPHYFIGAYTFSKEPPFEIKKFSPEPIVAKGFYQPPYHRKRWGSVRVVFPAGYVFDDQFIWLTYGRQDYEACVVKLDKKKFMDSLIPVATLVDGVD